MTRSLIQATESGQRSRVRNRRALSRLPVELPAQLVWDKVTHDAVITDLAAGGLFAECGEQAPFATALTVLVRHRGGTLWIPATVRWTSDCGMGMQFGLLGAREAHAIAELIESATK